MAAGREIGWGSTGGLQAVVLRSPRPSGTSAFEWLHLCSLFLLLSVVGVAGMVLVDGLALGASLGRLPMILYWWVPSVLGIVAAAVPVRQHSAASVALLLFVGGTVVLVLDWLGAALQSQQLATWALVQGESVQAWVSRSVHPESWVAVLAAWLSGNLPGASETLSSTYPSGHPRVVVLNALGEAGALLLVLSTVGVVLGVRRWIDEAVALRRPSNDLVVGTVLGWVIAPGLSVAAGSITSFRMSGVLFGGEPLATVLLPAGGLAAVGMFGLVYALRSSR